MKDNKKKKRFIEPTAEIVDFANDDIITKSVEDEFSNLWRGEEWESKR